jgi:hypothetical protein
MRQSVPIHESLNRAGKCLKAARFREAMRRLATYQPVTVFVLLLLLLLPAYGQTSVARFSSDATASIPHSAVQKRIVIGFVGGFVRHDEPHHPEVQLADRLRKLDNASIDAEVYANVHRERAFRKIMHVLDADHNGVVTAGEKQSAKIIIYGHSWGAEETVALARELEREGIPVLLTIQVDSILKPGGEEDSVIPANVESAINFYQTWGPLQGRRKIRAADPTRTTILGNFKMTYKEHPVNCDQNPWYARLFAKTHMEIENDPRVWEKVFSLIEADMPHTEPEADAASASR